MGSLAGERTSKAEGAWGTATAALASRCRRLQKIILYFVAKRTTERIRLYINQCRVLVDLCRARPLADLSVHREGVRGEREEIDGLLYEVSQLVREIRVGRRDVGRRRGGAGQG